MIRVNGRAIEDYKRFEVLETGLAVPKAEPLYIPTISNGYAPNDFVVDANLVLYLPLHLLKGSKFKSVDRYGYTCTVTEALWGPQGRYFDGVNDELSIGTGSDALDIDGDQITLLAWYKNVGATVNQGWIMGKMGTAAGGYGLSNSHPSGTSKVLFSADIGGWADYIGDTGLTSTAWNLYGVTYDGTTAELITLYQNGLADGTHAKTGNIASRAKPLVLADEEGWESQTGKGYIGEVWVYTRCLSAVEVLQNYNATKWRYH